MATTDEAATGAPEVRRWGPAGELVLVALATCASFLLASRIELHELFSRSVADLEGWQVDELPGTLTVLVAGLGWFAWRRWREGARQLAGRRRAEATARQLLARNQGLARSLLTMQEEERRALARDLHDDFGQVVHLLRVEAAYLGNLGESGNPEADAAIRRIRDSGEELNRLLRGMLNGLRPVLLDAMGLAPSLEELCQGWAEKSGIPCRFMSAGLPDDLDARLPGGAAIAIYRAVQEGLVNVMKHSGAREATVGLAVDRGDAGALALEIRDDGAGLSGDRRAGRFGLVGIDERMAAIGATMRVESAAGEGTRIRIRVPLPVRDGAS